MNRFFVVGILCCLALPLAGCGAQKPDWKLLVSEEGGFQVEMRGDPEVERHDSVEETSVVGYFLELEDGNYGCTVLAAELPEYSLLLEPLEVIEGHLQGSLERVGGSVLAQEELPVEDGVGLDVTAIGHNNGKPATIRIRYYLYGRKMYTLILATLPKDESEEETLHFFNSFQRIE